MNYEQTRTFLGNSMKFGSILGLDRMVSLMRLLGQPAMDIPCIHIAGTNGKGSVTAMAANILAMSGSKTGVYTSPFIHRFSERIRIIDGPDGVRALASNEEAGEISEDDTAECITAVAQAVEKILAEGGEHPTEFEIVTAAAFVYFQKQRCDHIVLETGLGGRLDSTNVVEKPLVCVISAIGYDHMDRLGNTIRQIASEKAGIIKKDSRVVMLDPFSYTSPADASIITEVIRSTAKAKGAADLTIVGSDRIKDLEFSIKGQRFDLLLPGRSEESNREVRIETSLLGVFQPMNCLTAAASMAILADDHSIAEGIRLSRWPGRFEVIRETAPLTITDGAHNIQGALALRGSIEAFLPGRDIVFLCGVMSDKDYKAMLSAVLFSDMYRITGVVCTRPDNTRALGSEDLAFAVSEVLDNSSRSGYNKSVKVLHSEETAEAVRIALDLAAENDSVMVAFGSLYMAGTVRRSVFAYGHDQTGVL